VSQRTLRSGGYVTGRQADDQWSLARLQRPGNGCGVGGAADVGGGVPHLRNECPNDDSRCPAVGSRFSSAVRIPNPFRVQTWPAARRIGCRPRSDLARGGMPVIKHVLTIKEIVAELFFLCGGFNRLNDFRKPPALRSIPFSRNAKAISIS